MSDPLSNLQFKEGGEGGDFIKFTPDHPVKVRVLTTNPTIHINNYGKEQISFAVWSFDEGKPMILSKGPSVARQISNLHRDEDFGADITQVDIKITPSGEGMSREYSISALPKTSKLFDKQIEDVKELDKKLSTIFKGSVRAEEYNNGIKPRNSIVEDGAPLDADALDSIPF